MGEAVFMLLTVSWRCNCSRPPVDTPSLSYSIFHLMASSALMASRTGSRQRSLSCAARRKEGYHEVRGLSSFLYMEFFFQSPCRHCISAPLTLLSTYLLLPRITNSKKMLLWKKNPSLPSYLSIHQPFFFSILLSLSIWWHTHVVGQHVEGLESWMQLFLA